MVYIILHYTEERKYSFVSKNVYLQFITLLLHVYFSFDDFNLQNDLFHAYII